MLIKIRAVSQLVKHKFNYSVFLSTSVYEERQTKIGDWNINYLKIGNGPRSILCMPGALGSIWTDFQPQIEGLNREKFTLVVWDPPGYGKSRPPDRNIPVNVFERDGDYAYELMKTLKLPTFSLLGWSFGSCCGMSLAAKYPDAVEKLVIWGASACIKPQDLKELTKLKDINLWSPVVRKQMMKIYGEELFISYSAQWIDSLIAACENKIANLSIDLLKTINCPTLILHGEKDPVINSLHMSYLHKYIKNSRIHLYPEGKHNIHIVYSEDFNKRVEEFLLEP